jgi:hypothetical protein
VGEAARRLWTTAGLAAGTAAIFVADRCARLYTAERIHLGAPGDAVLRALDWLSFAQSRCEECGAPVDWG